MHRDDEEKLWKELKVHFKLEANGFPDDKIYARIRIVPESSRRLIEKFELHVNGTRIADLDCRWTYVSASGFNVNTTKPRFVHIEAVPRIENGSMQRKTSDRHKFYFDGRSSFANPKITFASSNYENPSGTAVVIEWYHLGDYKAGRYLLYLDRKQIHRKSQFTEDKFSVAIHDLEVGTKHVLQLVATLGSKEIYRSDPLEFTVLEPSTVDAEVINVREDRMPATLPGF